jgi:hypothetical protein
VLHTVARHFQELELHLQTLAERMSPTAEPDELGSR